MDWIKRGVAPIPVDIRKNMKNFSLKYPLEYQELINEYLLTVSNTHLMNFSIYSDNEHVLSFGCNFHETYLYSLTFYIEDNVTILRSKDGYQFDMIDKNRSWYAEMPEEIRSDVLSDKRIQRMLGIEYLNSHRVDFFQPSK